MRNVKKSAVVLAAVLGAAPVATHAVSVTGPTLVAVTGAAAPAGGNYLGFSSPVLNGSGQIAFHASLTGGSSPSGHFAGAPGSLQAAALRNSAAPGGGTYNAFDALALNDAGQVAYLAFVTGAAGAKGIYAGAPGSVQAAAVQGTPSPAGPNYGDLGNLSPAPTLNNSGQVAFVANLAGGPSNFGLFAGAPGSMQAVAVSGTAAPAAAGNYAGFASAPVINDAGQVAFASTLTGGSSSFGIFAGALGSVQAIALQGTAAPAGGNYGGPSNFGWRPVINDAGRVAFVSTLTGGSSPSGVFAGAPGSLQTVALEGTAAPGGGNYTIFNAPVLNGAGRIAFSTLLAGGSSTRGIFTGTPGSLQTVALQAADTPEGVGNFDTFDQTVALNGAGQVAFTSSLSGTGVTAANDNGLYIWSASELVKIVREGDFFDLDPGPALDFRTVSGISFTPGSGGQDGKAMGFDDSGLLVYRLTFTNGSSGIFTSSIVPEPATTGLAGVLALTSLAAATRRRRMPRQRRESIA